MRFEIGRHVSEQCVSSGVRFVETVAGELLHQIENLFDFLLVVATLHSALDEAVPLLGHLFDLFLTHGAA